MLGDAWIVITVLITLAALVFKQAPLFIVAVLFFLTSGVARLWARYSLSRLEFKRELSANKAFWGDHITLDLSLANLKMLPLPWIMIQEEIPRGVSLLKGRVSPAFKNNRDLLSNFISLGWYHKITRRYPMLCSRRGIYVFGPATVSSGRKKTEVESLDRLTVYPRILTLAELGIPSRHPFGDLRIKRHLFEDPIMVMTTRDYVSSDPMKHIAWKATARMQRMQTRVFEHTTTVDLALFLDTRLAANTNYWSIISPDFLETAVLAAAAISSHAFKEGYNVGFYANEYYFQSEHLIKLPPSNNPDQMREILEALAQVQGIPALTMEELLLREVRQLNWESTIVLITPVVTLSLVALLKRLQRAGRRVALITIGKSGFDGFEGLQVYRVSEEVYKRNLESLNLQ